MNKNKLILCRIADLKKWRREICEEFDVWSMYYENKWFIDQMKQIDSQISKYELLLNTESRKIGKPLDRNIGNASVRRSS